MKTKISIRFSVLAVSIFLLSFGLKADEGGRSFQLGIMGSANLGWVKATQKPVQSNGAGLGFSYGITGDFSLSKTKDNYFLAVDFLSAHSRVKTKLNPDFSYKSKKDQLDYKNVAYFFKITHIEIPVSLKLKLNEMGYTTWFAQFGLAPSFLYSTQAKWEAERVGGGRFESEYFKNNKNISAEQEFEEYRDDIRWYRIATFFGAGMEYRFSGNTALVASLRFNNGLSNIFADNKTEPKGKGHNSFVALHAGLLF